MTIKSSPKKVTIKVAYKINDYSTACITSVNSLSHNTIFEP